MRVQSTAGLWQAFNSFDKDRSGYIDSTELRGILRTVGQEVTDDELHEMMDLADSNGSGKMDVSMLAHLKKNSARANTTHSLPGARAVAHCA